MWPLEESKARALPWTRKGSEDPLTPLLKERLTLVIQPDRPQPGPLLVPAGALAAR